jgi:hypothetical protein
MEYKHIIHKPNLELTDEEKEEEEKINSLTPDENGDLMENGEYIFKNRNIFFCQGDTIQYSFAYVKGVCIQECSCVPFNIFQEMLTHYVVYIYDLPKKDYIEYIRDKQWMWEDDDDEDNACYPVFREFDDAVEFIKKYLEENNIKKYTYEI